MPPCRHADINFGTQGDGTQGDRPPVLTGGQTPCVDGFHGREYNTVNIGKTMKKLQFESKTVRGTRKYLVVKVDYALHNTENKEDAKEFIPDMF